ncbi:MAG: DUF938 domain-containing protein [Pseudomonadota bacterium]
MASSSNNNPASRPREIALEDRGTEGDRLSSPSVARNRDVIRDAFVDLVPNDGVVLEIASGTGEHAVHIASALPNLTWMPSDPDRTSRQSIDAWSAYHGLQNIEKALDIDVTRANTPNDQTVLPAQANAIVCINMIHIAPFEATKGLFALAERILTPKGRLFLYGPFSRNGEHTAPSNRDFDESLKSRDKNWGVRDLDLEVTPLAQKARMQFATIREMPANNLVVVFEKDAD